MRKIVGWLPVVILAVLAVVAVANWNAGYHG